ncbi:MAG: hypothetical protein R3185_04580, partial [Candidatus Thermoplasmatota archaeon]|nr:hypothetical protein [Candidatus Thermoplasmatota archaeon]
VDVDEVRASPAILQWEDANGQDIPPEQIADHPVNDDFAAKVDVLGYGFRNIFGVAFAPSDLPFAGAAYTAMNGADSPASQDALYKITPGADHGFPRCYNVGPAGGTGDEVSAVPAPDEPDADCTGVPPATALLGWHTCATGLDFPTDGPASFPETMHQSVFVAECAVFFANDWVTQVAQDEGLPHHSVSHKVVRVPLDQDGEATAVQDFVTGLALPTDVLFGPDGAMYIADAEGIFRVAPVG